MGKGKAPVVTGSVAPAVEVQGPLPETLAYSDAAKIGQAAGVALWQAGGPPPDGWVNVRTGSSGTLKPGARAAATSPDCRPFSTTVTSLAGVHQYSGAVCRADASRTIIKIAEEALARSS